MIGTFALNFTAFDQNNQKVELYNITKKNKFTVLVFYPMDNSPGCTIQLKKYSDKFKEFQSLNTQIIGISMDSIESHKKFSEDKNLPFPIVSDLDGSISKNFNSLNNMNLLVKKITLSKRNTFILNQNNEIISAFEDVSVFSDTEQILEKIKSLSSKK